MLAVSSRLKFLEPEARPVKILGVTVDAWVPVERSQREALALDTVKLAVELGIDINAANVDGRTALYAAKALKFERVSTYLVERGAKPGVTDKKDEPRS